MDCRHCRHNLADSFVYMQEVLYEAWRYDDAEKKEIDFLFFVFIFYYYDFIFAGYWKVKKDKNFNILLI